MRQLGMTLGTTAVIVIGTLVTFVWSVTQGANFLVGGGSSSVVPMMNDFLAFYQHARQGNPNILYNAIGSSASLAGIRRGAYQFGFLSKTVDDKLATNLYDQDQVFRFVVARDPVMIIYNIGSANDNLKGGTGAVFNAKSVGDQTGNHIVFGQKGKSAVRPLSKVIQQFYFNHQSWTSVFQNRIKGLPNQAPQVISREAGSGTRSFFEKSILSKKGDYQANQYVGSNQLMLDAVAQTNNSIGYLSFEYAKSILDHPDKYGNVHVGAVDFVISPGKISTQLPWKHWKPKHKVEGNTGYALYRPFTGIFRSTGRNAREVLRFVAWMINPYTKKTAQSHDQNAVSIIEEHGLFPVFPGDTDQYFQKFNNWNKASTFKLIQKFHLYQNHKIPGNYQVHPL